MIQRIQTVFLFLIVCCMIALLFITIWSKTDPATGDSMVLTAYSLTGTGALAAASKSTIAIAILAVAAGSVALYEIFQYRNRLTQIKLGFLNTLTMILLMGACFYYSTYVGEELVAPQMKGEFEPGFYLPALGLILNVLANRFIKRDEDLVRSVDRLR
jgi:hypothetical protein